MKIKRMVAAITMTVCLAAAAVCMTGCGTKYSVTLNNVSNGNSYTLSVGKGKTVNIDMIFKAYPDESLFLTGLSTDENLYTDKTCRTKFVGTVNSDMTLYYGSYSPEVYGRAIFVYSGKEYTIYRLKGTTLTAEDFSLSAYGYGTPSDYKFYSDKEHTTPLDIAGVEVTTFYPGEDDIKIFVADAV